MIAKIGTIVRDLREEHGLTQAELADAAGIGTATLSRLEIEDQLGEFRVLESVAEVLGTTAVALLVSAERETAKSKRKRATARK